MLLKFFSMRRIFTALLLSMLAAAPIAGQATEQPQTTTASTPAADTLQVLTDEYFDKYFFPENPSLATLDGIHTYDDRLEDYSKAAIKNKITTLKQFETRVAAVKPDGLTLFQQGDRDLVLNNIRSQLLTLENIRPWEKNPDFYSSGIANSAFVIMERKFAPADDRVRVLIAREKLMPAALQTARQNLKNPPKIYTQIALEQLPGLVNFFQKDVPLAFADVRDPALKKQFAASNAAVIKSLLSYQIWLKKNVLPHANGDFRIGADAFKKKLMYDEMVDLSLDKLIDIDMTNMRANQNEFARIAKELDPAKTPQQILKELTQNHPHANKLLDSFGVTFDDLIKFIKDKEIITIPSDVRPILEPTPPFMTATTFASMDTPGPFEAAAKEAYFNVTLPDPKWSKAKTNDFMTLFSYPLISNISTHETYPGHYVQFLWMHDVNDRVRKILGANTNAEGWAHYCEQMMLDEGFRQPGQGAKNESDAKMYRLGQLQNALLRNARFVVGIKMHTGQMTFEQAVDFFVNEGYQSRTVGTIETKRGTMDPTYLYYTLGKLQIMKLREDMKTKLGDAFNLKQFHDDFMREGYPPIKIVRKAMLQDDSPTL